MSTGTLYFVLREGSTREEQWSWDEIENLVAVELGQVDEAQHGESPANVAIRPAATPAAGGGRAIHRG